MLEKVSAAGSEHVAKPPQESDERIIEKSLGAFSGIGRPTVLPETQSWLCCTPNCTQALYYVWESIVRCKDDVAQVNLLLNRVSPWLDVDSYLPYEGKAVIKNKTAKKLFVRIPRWVDKNTVRCQINDLETPLTWLGNYLVFGQLGGKDVIAIEFPIVEETAKYTLHEGFRGLKETTTYTCYFKGNTLVDISPREDGPWYPIFQRDYYKKDKAPMKTVQRYVSPVTIEW